MTPAKDLHREVIHATGEWVKPTGGWWHYAPLGLPLAFHEATVKDATFTPPCGMILTSQDVERTAFDKDSGDAGIPASGPAMLGVCAACIDYRRELEEIEAARRKAKEPPDKPTITVLVEKHDERVVHHSSFVDVDGEESCAVLYIEKRRQDALGAPSWVETLRIHATSVAHVEIFRERGLYELIMSLVAAVEERAAHAAVVAATAYQHGRLDKMSAGSAAAAMALLGAAREYHRMFTVGATDRDLEDGRRDLCAAAVIYGGRT